MIELFSKHGLCLSPEQEKKLKLYYTQMIEWNQNVNLTSIVEYEEVIRKHFLDSALLLKIPDPAKEDSNDENPSGLFLPEKPIRVMDVGTGAGFPGLVLAILCPEWEVVLLDSLQKRIDFLNTLIAELSLSNVRAIHGRAEEVGRDEKNRLGFDLVVSRAVADLRLLLEFCIPFVSDDGYFVSYKGPRFEDEILSAARAMEELNVNAEFDQHFDLEGEQRVLVGFHRTGPLPEKYPRRPGIPSKRPL